MEDISVGKDGISISWKLFVGVILIALGYYVTTQIAPLRSEMTELRVAVTGLSARVVNLEAANAHNRTP